MAKGKQRDGRREARWRGILAEQEFSGLGVRAFCRLKGVRETPGTPAVQPLAVLRSGLITEQLPILLTQPPRRHELQGGQFLLQLFLTHHVALPSRQKVLGGVNRRVTLSRLSPKGSRPFPEDT
jgi:hypothetical protein